MMNIIEKIISGNNQLQICGYIPITNENTNVAFISSHRYGVSGTPHFLGSKTKVPFEFTIYLPPLYTRIKKDYDKIYSELHKRAA